MKIKKELQKDLRKATARRIARMKQEFNKKFNLTVFENESGYDQMIAQVGIPVSAVCEHHEVAFSGHVNIAYICDKWLVGLSKLARIAEKHFNPTVKTLQERGTHNIMKELVKLLKPKGVMVVVKAQHNCITYRGVKKPSTTITSAVHGAFAEQGSDARKEFLTLLN